MLLSLLKIGLLSIFACNIPSTLLADSSSKDHTANNEVVFKQDNKKNSYAIANDLTINDYYYYRFKDSSFLPSITNQTDAQNYYFSFYDGGDDRDAILKTFDTYIRDTEYLHIERIYSDYNSSNFSIYAHDYVEGVNLLLLRYTFSTQEYSFGPLATSNQVLIIPNSFIFSDDSYKTNFFKFYDNQNARVDLGDDWRYGLIIGSDNFIRPYDNTEHAYNYYNGTYRLNLMDWFSDAYRATSGLYYYNGKIYTSLVYNLYYLPSGTKVMSNNGQPMTLTSDQVMVGSIALANGTTGEYTNHLTDYAVLLASSFVIYDNSEYATGHYIKYAGQFISIGSTIEDVEYINLANTDNNFYTFLNNIRGHYDYPVYVAPVDVQTDYDPTDTLTASFSLIRYTLTNLTSFFGIELIKGITIGALILIPFAITLLLFVVKLFKR